MFTVKEYRFHFAIWAAYRAVQAGSSKASGLEFSSALKHCEIIDYIDNYDNEEVTLDEFNLSHKGWCNFIISFMEEKYQKKFLTELQQNLSMSSLKRTIF